MVLPSIDCQFKWWFERRLKEREMVGCRSIAKVRPTHGVDATHAAWFDGVLEQRDT